MLLRSIVLLTTLSLAVSKVLIGESLFNNGNHRNRRNHKRRQIIDGENDSGLFPVQNDSPLYQNPTIIDDNIETVTSAGDFELDKPSE